MDLGLGFRIFPRAQVYNTLKHLFFVGCRRNGFLAANSPPVEPGSSGLRFKLESLKAKPEHARSDTYPGVVTIPNNPYIAPILIAVSI